MFFFLWKDASLFVCSMEFSQIIDTIFRKKWQFLNPKKTLGVVFGVCLFLLWVGFFCCCAGFLFGCLVFGFFLNKMSAGDNP